MIKKCVNMYFHLSFHITGKRNAEANYMEELKKVCVFAGKFVLELVTE
jgi:hypothetical protein